MQFSTISRPSSTSSSPLFPPACCLLPPATFHFIFLPTTLLNRIHLTSFRLCFPHFCLVPRSHFSPSFSSLVSYLFCASHALLLQLQLQRRERVLNKFFLLFFLYFWYYFRHSSPSPSPLHSLPLRGFVMAIFSHFASAAVRQVRERKRARERERNKSKLCSAGAGTEQIPSQIQICDFKLIRKAAEEQAVASLIQLPIFGYLMHLFMDFEIVLCSARAANDAIVWFFQAMMGRLRMERKYSLCGRVESSGRLHKCINYIYS